MVQKNNIYYFKTLGSTMDVASKLADQGCPNYTVVVAEQQNSGCGRMGRIWCSDKGGLYFSIIIRPNILVDLSAYIGFAVALDIANIIRDLFGIDARLKWPNDILVGNRKICGILSRVKINENKITYANIGVGLNVNNKPHLIEPNAVSILDILGREVQIHDILSKFLNCFRDRVPNLTSEHILQEWKELSVTLGKFVKIITLKDHIEGLATDLDSKGGLEVLMKDGSIKTAVYGECFHY